jgi:hypothetical protein
MHKKLYMHVPDKDITLSAAVLAPRFLLLCTCCRAHITALEQSVFWLDTLVAYVKQNSVSSWEQGASMAAEMASLLKEKLALTNRQMAMQQRLHAAA